MKLDENHNGIEKTSLSTESKDTQINSFLAVSSHLKPIGKQTLIRLAYRFGVMPEHLYILIEEMGGACHG